MKTIDVESDYLQIKNRIKSLSASSTRKWGGMKLDQMLSHCTTQLEIALGEKAAEIQGPAIMRSRLGKWISLTAIPWPKGSFTPKEMNMVKLGINSEDIEDKKKRLLEYLERSQKEKELKAHPFFGSLTRKEWSRLIYKHLDHHLRQFGV